VRARYGLDASAPVILYTGTFEAYQGLDLLFAAATGVLHARPDARFVLAGGAPAQIDAFKAHVRGLGIDGQVVFTGERPASEIPDLLAAADVLVSPRSRGTNTPLKIYQYLRSGRVIVATRLLTHTQVLDDGVAILTDATPAAFAGGILQAIGDTEAAARIGGAAAQLAATKYSYEAYLARTREAIGRLGPDSRATLSGSAA
jgi:glycosyltransferase involved in cell wall biosynthesis